MRFWIILTVVILLQAVYTLSSRNQIRLEEIIETYRSVWWFQNRLVWNGSYAFLGWSATQVLVYNLLGSSFFAPKYIKLFIETVSFLCLALFLKKYIGEKRMWLPMLLVGLSPTFMYFNSLQLSMGLEVSYFFILLYLISILPFGIKKNNFWMFVFIGMLGMFAWLSYFGFIFYFPILLLFYIYNAKYYLKKGFRVKQEFLKFSVAFIGFLIPLILLFLYIHNRNLLIYDPLSGKGLFRSYGTVEFNIKLWFENIGILYNDLFIKHRSYYFEQTKVEFSDFYPIIGVIGTFLVSIYLILKNKKMKKPILVYFFLAISYLILQNFIGPHSLGGIRRVTSLIVIFYSLVTYLWMISENKKTSHKIKLIITVICGILLTHHIIVYPINLVSLKNPSIFTERYWFWGDRPEKKLSDMISLITKTDLSLQCTLDRRTAIQCPSLSILYPAIAGTCYWNKLDCHKILVYDPSSQKYTPLNLKLWGENPHTEP